jgi:DNA-binding Xre family transcriptional regulator
MNEIDTILAQLKFQLKAHGITYAHIAHHLSLSEASVKRIFSKKEVSLARLEKICHLVNLNLSDVFDLVKQKQRKIHQLSNGQEQLLVEDKTLLLVAICVVNHWQFDDILHYHSFDQYALIQKLAQLDKMRIIELLPANRIKPLLHQDFDWIKNGPIQRFFQQTISQEFFTSNFDKESEVLIVRSGMLSEQENALLQKSLKNTAEQFIATCQSNKKVSIDKRHGTALVIAMRPWVPSIFERLIR